MPSKRAPESDTQRPGGSAGSTVSVLLFSVGGTHGALELESVSCVLHAAAITPLPGAPRGVRGLLNLSGALLPVFDPALRFGLPQRDMELSDRFIVARTGRREVALLVESVEGLGQCPEPALAAARKLRPRPEGIKGATVLENGVAVIYDLEGFLSPSEEQELQAALAEKGEEK